MMGQLLYGETALYRQPVIYHFLIIWKLARIWVQGIGQGLGLVK